MLTGYSTDRLTELYTTVCVCYFYTSIDCTVQSTFSGCHNLFVFIQYMDYILLVFSFFFIGPWFISKCAVPSGRTHVNAAIASYYFTLSDFIHKCVLVLILGVSRQSVNRQKFSLRHENLRRKLSNIHGLFTVHALYSVLYLVPDYVYCTLCTVHCTPYSTYSIYCTVLYAVCVYDSVQYWEQLSTWLF